MKYYVTIYIQPMDWNIPHAFLGLTKGKSPDDLDKIDDELRLQRLKNKEWDRIDERWYEAKEINEFNDGFYGFGTSGNDFGITEAAVGKVFNNNQYIINHNTQTNTYDFKKLRSSQTFKPSNRLILEISQEQYETLLQNIKKDYETTKDIKPQSTNSINKEFNYKFLENNCVTWVMKQLSNIGIEMINEKIIIPSDFIKIFSAIKYSHSIFLKFQNIDDNLKSVKGAKAFMAWTRKLIDNPYIQQKHLDEFKGEKLSKEKD